MKIGIQNFQGITDYQEIELAPLTLIYGPNSAGKSTLVDAMKVGADLYEKGPSAMPLEWIHSSQSGLQSGEFNTKTIIRFEGLSLDEYSWDERWRYDSGIEILGTFPPDFIFSIYDEIERRDNKRINFAVQYGWQKIDGRLYLCEYQLEVDREWLFDWQGHKKELAGGVALFKGNVRINLQHPLFITVNRKTDIVKSSSWDIECVGGEARFDDVIESFKGPFVEIFSDGYMANYQKGDELVDLVATFVAAFSLKASTECRQYEIPPIRPINAANHLVRSALRTSDYNHDVWGDISVSVVRHYFGELAEHKFLRGVDLDEINHFLSEQDFLDTGFCVTGDIRFSASADVMEKIFAASEENRMALLAELAEITVTPKLHDKRRGCDVAIHDVGAGISQVIPVLVASQYWKAHIQQPELHLHPKMQARIADVFIQQLNLAENPNDLRFLLETHSELLVLRVLRRIRETWRADIKSKRFALTPDLVSVLYVDRSSQGVTTFKRLRISPEGEFLDRWPDGFFAERDAELFDDE
jgi:hypothetical protein